jgi:hypothetical protein
MIRIYNDHDYQELLSRVPKPEYGEPGFLARRSIYGQRSATDLGLAPIHDFPDVLVDVADFKAVILECNERQVFARYHQDKSGVFSSGWSQSRYNLCWAYCLAAATMGCRAVEGKPPVRLSPFSLGWLVDWRNRGYYIDKALAGAAERGIASEEFVPQYNLNPRSFKEGWEENALQHRPTGWWDTRRADGEVQMIRQCLSILKTGRPLPAGYNWWGHATEVVGMEWDETQLHGIVWVIRNSHDEPDVIRLAGERGIPDEAYGERSTSFPQAA